MVGSTAIPVSGCTGFCVEFRARGARTSGEHFDAADCSGGQEFFSICKGDGGAGRMDNAGDDGVLTENLEYTR